MPRQCRSRERRVVLRSQAGDEITATYVVDGHAVCSRTSWSRNRLLIRESYLGEGVDPKPGDEVPNFRLVNQDGKPVRIHDYKGKTLLLTFIFTRCQDPDQCTLMSSNFAAIDQLLQKETELHKRTHLLSVSFDTEYDTPKVLRSYGASYTGKYSDETFEHWEFATGTSDEVKGIAQFFGLRYYKDAKTGNEQIIHSLRTAVRARGVHCDACRQQVQQVVRRQFVCNQRLTVSGR